MIERHNIENMINLALGRSPVVALVGPRQSGKTTLARQFVPADSTNYFDLEDPVSLGRLEEPETALSALEGLVVIDEVQRRPEIFPLIRVLADRRPLPARFLILGSASPELLRQSSESLAGRLETLEITGFTTIELGQKTRDRLWLRGGLPPSFLAATDEESIAWRSNFIRAFTETDLRAAGLALPAQQLHRFWTMVAHYHGNLWNNSELARSLGIGQPTVRRYLDVLTGLFMVRQLQPWHENLKKRQVKMPKVYIKDTGLLHALIGVKNIEDLLSYPKSGASWEGFVIEEVLQRIRPDEAYFWATHQGAELDLLLMKNGKRIGFEIKRNDAPRLTNSMRNALQDLSLDELTVIYPGTKSYRLLENTTVLPFRDIDKIRPPR